MDTWKCSLCGKTHPKNKEICECVEIITTPNGIYK